jgi:hypothetical protein
MCRHGTNSFTTWPIIGRAAHAAAHDHANADFAGGIAHEVQADVVQQQRRAVAFGAVDRDLELARQPVEFGVERRPLAQDLGEGARIDDLVGRHAGEMVVVMLRTQLPEVWMACISTVGQEPEDVGHVSSFGQLYWRFCRVLKWP